MKVKVFILLIILLLPFSVASAQENKEISKQEAIRMAEEFIAQKKIYKYIPSNTLVPKALAIQKSEYKGQARWYVTFGFKLGNCPECPTREKYRIVRMDLDGSNVRLEPKYMPLEKIGKKF